MSRHTHRRSGVILLIILALLALFTLLGLGLVIITSQARRISREQTRVDQVGDPPHVVVRSIAFDVIKGSTNPLSPIGNHSLLEDLYGTHDLTGTIAVVTPIANGQMLVLSFSNTGPDLRPGVAGVDDNASVQPGPDDVYEFYWPGSDDMSRALSVIDDDYSGRVFTLLTGAAQGTSTRVLGYRFIASVGPDGENGHAGYDDDGDGTNDDADELGWPGTDDGIGQVRILTASGVTPAVGDRFLVNGREFSGPGIGYRDDNPLNTYIPRLLDAWDPEFTQDPVNQQFPLALLPNAASQNYQLYLRVGPDGQPGVADFDDNADNVQDNAAEIGWPGSDDGLLYANEDYDAADYHNMFLALQLPSGDTLLPSYHRPDLVNYWARGRDVKLIDSALTPPRNWWHSPTSPPGLPVGEFARRLRRKVLMRPAPDDHAAQDSGGASATNPGGNLPADQQALFEFREPLLDANGNGFWDTGEVFWDLDKDGEWDAGDFDFTGKPFNPITGPWDVDNDGDGIADSIWIDPGLPAQVTPDGKQYKRLAAVLVNDLGGRLNLNAHGTVAHLPQPQLPPAGQMPYAGAPGAVVNLQNVPQGEGYGVAEVNLSSVLQHELFVDNNGNGRHDGGEPDANNDGVVDSEYLRLLYGQVAEPYSDTNSNGRYDFNSVTFQGGNPVYDEPFVDLNNNGVRDAAVDGRYGELYLLENDAPASPQAGRTGFDDNLPLAVGRYSAETAYTLLNNINANPSIDGFAGDGTLYGLNPPGANTYANLFTNVSGVYGSPVSLKGMARIGLDLRGQPLYPRTGPGVTNPVPIPGSTYAAEALNDPYQLDLSREGRRGKELNATAHYDVDSPFGPDELEALLRWFDIDAQSLPTRLKTLLPTLSRSAVNRRRVTTESWDLPTPAMLATPEIMHGLRELGQATPPQSIADLVRGKIRIMDRYGYGGPIDYTKVVRATQFEIFRVNQLTKRLLGTSQYIANRTDGFEGLAPELLYGQRFDLNRPFGNNADDSPPGTPGYGVVDEPGEAQIGERLWEQSVIDTPQSVADNNGDGKLGQSFGGFSRDQYARYRYAKHLYILLMLLKDRDYVMPISDAESTEGLSLEARRDLTTRRLAQFAINVVDYRDRDSIMTPFEYDAHPFTDQVPLGTGDLNPWDVDGELRNAGTPPTNENQGVDYRADFDRPRRVVWGCEFPDLLLTETLGFHDRRVADTDAGGGRTTQPDMSLINAADATYDQVRVPEGSAFFELYCVRNQNNPMFPAELSRQGNPSQQLDLGRLAPDAAARVHPVWRLAISESRYADPENDMRHRLAQRPDSVSLQPEDPNVAQLSPGVPIDRIVWFTTTPPGANTIDANKIYYNRSTTALPLLSPGNYALVGPARDTVTGAGRHVTSIGVVDAEPFTQQISLEPFVRVTDNFLAAASRYRYPTEGTEIQTSLGIPVAGTTTDLRNVGINISEPPLTAYYPLANVTSKTNTDQRLGLGAIVTADVLQPTDPEPWDNSRLLGDELSAEGLYTRTVINYRTVFLQRLANPLLPHNPDVGEPEHNPNLVVNPYMTIDWMPIDLTIFNSEAGPTDSQLAGVNASDKPPPPNQLQFGSRQRGSQGNIWEAQSEQKQGSQNPIEAVETPQMAQQQGMPVVQSGHHFKPLLDQTLGYLNRPLHSVPPAYTVTPYPRGWWISPSVIDNYAANDNPVAANYPQYNGDPVKPFPWLQWANRPFISNLELLQVPASSPSRLFHELTMKQSGSDYQDRDPNEPAPSRPYGHLANFLYSSDVRSLKPGTGTSPGPDDRAPNLHRLFEFVHVPSRFSGGESMLDPRVFRASPPNNLNGFDNPPGLLYPFYAPFNRVSRYREPGRVNINTIYDDPFIGGVANAVTWQAITNNYPGYGAFWNQVWQSRQGYVPQLGTTSFPINPGIAIHNLYGSMFAIDDDSPTVFANPFRSYGSTYQVPAEILRWQNLMRNPVGQPLMRNFVDVGLLRPSVETASNSGHNTGDPLLALNSAQDFNDTNRNPAFRYQQFQKLGNILTNRSNVFAVWVTVGMFEVERVGNSLVHPDGWRLVRELNSDTGDVERHRAFYIIDRTIPVGFQRGRTNNVRDAILLERFIE